MEHRYLVTLEERHGEYEINQYQCVWADTLAAAREKATNLAREWYVYADDDEEMTTIYPGVFFFNCGEVAVSVRAVEQYDDDHELLRRLRLAR